MKNQRAYSTPKFFVLCAVCIILGVASAVSVTTLAPPMAQPPTTQGPSSYVLLTDKDTYYINEAMIIYIMNTLQETVNFKDDAYGLHFERLVNGKWEFMLSIGNSSRTTTLHAIGEDVYKAAVTYELGENFVEGKYKVVSVGEIKNDAIASVAAHKEFNVIQKPPPQTVLPLLTVKTDKAVYSQGDNMTVTLENESNETISFGDSSYGLFFEKWNGASWEFYTWVGPLEVITTLDPGGKVEIIYRLSGQIEKPFLQGRYRAASVGWIYRNGESVRVGGLAEFNIE